MKHLRIPLCFNLGEPSFFSKRTYSPDVVDRIISCAPSKFIVADASIYGTNVSLTAKCTVDAHKIIASCLSVEKIIEDTHTRLVANVSLLNKYDSFVEIIRKINNATLDDLHLAPRMFITDSSNPKCAHLLSFDILCRGRPIDISLLNTYVNLIEEN